MLRQPRSRAFSLPFLMLKGMSTRPATRLKTFVVPADPGTSCFGKIQARRQRGANSHFVGRNHKIIVLSSSQVLEAWSKIVDPDTGILRWVLGYARLLRSWLGHILNTKFVGRALVGSRA